MLVTDLGERRLHLWCRAVAPLAGDLRPFEETRGPEIANDAVEVGFTEVGPPEQFPNRGRAPIGEEHDQAQPPSVAHGREWTARDLRKPRGGRFEHRGAGDHLEVVGRQIPLLAGSGIPHQARLVGPLDEEVPPAGRIRDGPHGSGSARESESRIATRHLGVAGSR